MRVLIVGCLGRIHTVFSRVQPLLVVFERWPVNQIFHTGQHRGRNQTCCQSLGKSRAALVAWRLLRTEKESGKKVSMAQFVRQAVAQKETVFQAVEVLHNVGLFGGPANMFEKGIRPWPEGRLPTHLRVLRFMSKPANHNHIFEAESHATQIPEILDGVGGPHRCGSVRPKLHP